MFVLLPSYVVTFEPKPRAQKLRWRVNTDEALDAFCKILRLNGVTTYSVTRLADGPGQSVAA